MIAVLKKELKSYLLTPIGYMYIGLFLLIFSLFFYISIFENRSINFEYLFINGATILTFVSPLLTMRAFSEERKTGTEQLLLTSPRSITSIVLGKFFAAAVILIITEIFTIGYFIILSKFGKPSIFVAISTLFGFLLLSLCYVSFGLFASSITENQIVAAILSIGVFMAMWFIPSAAEWFTPFSLIYKFDNFPVGILSLSEILSFLVFIITFLVLTIIVMQKRKSLK